MTKEQRNLVIEWAAAGLKSDEINERARAQNPPFQVNREQVRYYRATRGIRLAELAESSEFDALTSGLAVKAERVRRLQLLAGLLEEDLFNGATWVDDVKTAGKSVVHVERFNSAEVEQYRGLLDDIAKEMGERSRTTLAGDKDNPLEVRTYVFPDNGRPHPGRKDGA